MTVMQSLELSIYAWGKEYGDNSELRGLSFTLAATPLNSNNGIYPLSFSLLRVHYYRYVTADYCWNYVSKKS